MELTMAVNSYLLLSASEVENTNYSLNTLYINFFERVDLCVDAIDPRFAVVYDCRRVNVFYCLTGFTLTS